MNKWTYYIITYLDKRWYVKRHILYNDNQWDEQLAPPYAHRNKIYKCNWYSMHSEKIFKMRFQEDGWEAEKISEEEMIFELL